MPGYRARSRGLLEAVLRALGIWSRVGQLLIPPSRELDIARRIVDVNPVS